MQCVCICEGAMYTYTEQIVMIIYDQQFFQYKQVIYTMFCTHVYVFIMYGCQIHVEPNAASI